MAAKTSYCVDLRKVHFGLIFQASKQHDVTKNISNIMVALINVFREIG